MIAAIIIGLWMSSEQATAGKRPQAEKKVLEAMQAPEELPKVSLQSQRAEAASKSSSLAREFRQIIDIDKRIAFLYEKAPHLPESEVIALMSTAGDDPSSKVRMESMLVLENLPNTTFRKDFLAAMAEDRDASVKDYAFQAISNLDMNERVDILGRVLRSENMQAVRRSAETLGLCRSKTSVEVLLAALLAGSLNTEHIQPILNALNRCLQKSFINPDEAKNWWNKNSILYADDLGQISPQ